MTSLEELAKFYGGPQWQTDQIKKLEALQARAQDDQIDALKYSGAVTGRMSGGMQFNTIAKPFKPTREDINLLNKLAQPLPAQKVERRACALQRCLDYAARGTERLLSGEGSPEIARAYLDMAEKYKALYKFTEEELNGSST